MTQRFFSSLFIATLWSAIIALSPSVAADCPEGNIMSGLLPISAVGVESPGFITDNWLVPPSSPVSVSNAATLGQLGTFVDYDLGKNTQIQYLSLQADNNDIYVVSASLDGKSWTPLWTVPAVSEPGFQERTEKNLSTLVRYIRLSAIQGDSISEGRRTQSLVPTAGSLAAPGPGHRAFCPP